MARRFFQTTPPVSLFENFAQFEEQALFHLSSMRISRRLHLSLLMDDGMSENRRCKTQGGDGWRRDESSSRNRVENEVNYTQFTFCFTPRRLLG